MAGKRRQLAATLFADLVGYSRLMGHDEKLAISAVEAFRAVLLHAAEAHRGRIIDLTGDAGFLAFGSTVDALHAALDIHRRLSEPLQISGESLTIRARVGLHAGDIVEKEGRLYGDDVNIAARLESLAEPGTVCISDTVYRQTRKLVAYRAVALGEKSLKNIPDRIYVYLVIPRESDIRDHARILKRAAASRIDPRWVLASAVVLLTLIGATLYWQKDTLARQAYYVEYNPFSGITNSDTDDYFREGVFLAIVSQLGRLENVYLVPSSRKIGAQLRIEGSVQKQTNQLRIAYRLVRTRDDAQVGGGVVDGPLTDVFSLQDQAANQIVALLGSVWNLATTDIPPNSRTKDLTTYDFYLQGQAYLRRPKTMDTLKNAETLFRRALERDPGYGPAHAGVCLARWKRYELALARDDANAALAACEKAHHLAPDSSVTLIALGTVYSGTGQIAKAESAFEDAIQLDHKSEEAFRGLANVYETSNRVQMAESTYKRAISLQPNHWEPHNWLGVFYYLRGRTGDAIESFRKVVELTPDNAYGFSNLCAALLTNGQFAEALSACRRSVDIQPTAAALNNTAGLYRYTRDFESSASTAAAAIKLAPDDYHSWMIYAQALSNLPGRTEQAEAAWTSTIELANDALRVAKEDGVIAMNLAIAWSAKHAPNEARAWLGKGLAWKPGDPWISYAAALTLIRLNDKDKAVTYLQQAVELGLSRDFLAMDPELDPLRPVPAFAALVSDPAGVNSTRQ